MQRQSVVEGSVACVLLLLAARYLYLPALAGIHTQEVALRDLEVRRSDAQGLAEKLPGQAAALQQEQEQVERLKNRIESAESLAHVLEMLQRQAKNYDLELTAVQRPPSEEESASPATAFGSELAIREVPLTLQLVGRFRQLGEFLGKLLQVPFMVTVQELTVAKAETMRGRVRADVALSVYLPSKRTALE